MRTALLFIALLLLFLHSTTKADSIAVYKIESYQIDSICVDDIRAGEEKAAFEVTYTLNFEVHHIIPIKVFENNQELQRILNKFGFDFNSIENGIPLQKKSKLFDVNGHGSHPDYDRLIEQKINNILLEAIDESDAFEKIQELISDINKKLETEVLLGNKNVNDIIL